MWDGSQIELTSSDGANNDYFGFSVAMSGDGQTLVVGAPQSDQGGSDRGAAYVYQINGSGDWAQVLKLTASDKANNDLFGGSVAISSDGTVIVVGAYGVDIGGKVNCGRIYIYSGTTWATETKKEAATNLDTNNMGWSVAISRDGSTVAAGVPNDTISGAYAAGSVYMFNGTSWGTRTKLFASGTPLAQAAFGYSVSVSDDGVTVLVGASEVGITPATAKGKAYVYNGTTWGTQTTLTASDRANGDNFGVSVALSGDAAIAVVGNSNHTAVQKGNGYIYSGANWATETKITASDATNEDVFSICCATSETGNVVFFGAMNKTAGDPSNPGRAYCLHRTGVATWEEVALLNPPSQTLDYWFAAQPKCLSCDSDGGVCLAGAIEYDPEIQEFGPGAAFVQRVDLPPGPAYSFDKVVFAQ